jgi:hypothetical protein
MVAADLLSDFRCPGSSAETRARIVGKLSSYAHECPRCAMRWECGETDYHDECPYPTKTQYTKCWAQGPASAASLARKATTGGYGRGLKPGAP